MSSLTKTLATLLGECRHGLEIHPIWHGYCSRPLGWSATRWVRPDAYYVVYICHAGELHYAWNGQTFSISPSQAIVIGPTAYPDIRWSEGTELREIWIKLPVARGKCTACFQIETMSAPAETAELIEHISAEATALGQFQDLPLLRPRLYLLLALLSEAAAVKPNKERILTPYQRLRLTRWTREHLSEAPNTEALANLLGLTSDYFARLFKNTFHISPRDWMIRERVNAARRLLDEGTSISDSMRQTGFQNAVHFGRMIKKITGRSPRKQAVGAVCDRSGIRSPSGHRPPLQQTLS